MAIFSTLRSRRLATLQTEDREQMITFRLRQEWFALPILAVQKVVLLGKVYGDPQKKGVGLTAYENQEIIVIDVAKLIFKDLDESNFITKNIDYENKSLMSEVSFEDTENQRYLLIINLMQTSQNLLGLPIDSQPVMRRVAKSEFKTLPDAYLNQGNIHCLSHKVIELLDHPLIFLLDIQNLVEMYNI